LAKKRILSISYDQALLVTRQLILEQQGYEVSSAFGFAEAMEICSFPARFRLGANGTFYASKGQEGPAQGPSTQLQGPASVHTQTW
jgi:hypothetical protein